MSSDLFNEALSIWSESNPQAAVYLPNVDCSRLHFVHTKQQELNLQNDASYYYHSPQNALQESQEWFSKLPLEDVEVLYVYGVGLGYAHEASLNWLKASPRHSLIFLEDDRAVIHRLFETELGLKLLKDPQVKLIHFDSVEEAHGPISEIYWQVLTTKMAISALPFYAQSRKQEFNELQERLTYECTLRQAILQEYLDHGAPYYRNFYRNIRLLPGTTLGDALKDAFTGTPAIICGAGPSLNKHLALLKSLEDKALIFAGGSALNALNVAGIRPHLGAGIDPNPEQFVRMKANVSMETPFLYRNRMDYNALSTIRGRRLYISGGGGYDTAKWFEQELQIPTEEIDEGFNVINFCLDIARLWGCNPIIFVGMDLAYTQLQAYAAGVVAEASVEQEYITSRKDLDDRAVLKKDIFGEPIYTLWKWVTESQWIGDFAKKYPQKKLINATEGGLGFPGVPNLSLDTVITLHLNKKYELRDYLKQQIDKHVLTQVTPERIEELLDLLKESLERCAEHLDVLISDLEEVMHTIKQKQQVPASLQSGLAALAETELSEEVAFQAILNIFNTIYSKVLSHELRTIDRQGPQVEQAYQKLSLALKRYQFLRDVVKTHLILIK